MVFPDDKITVPAAVLIAGIGSMKSVRVDDLDHVAIVPRLGSIAYLRLALARRPGQEHVSFRVRVVSPDGELVEHVINVFGDGKVYTKFNGQVELAEHEGEEGNSENRL